MIIRIKSIKENEKHTHEFNVSSARQVKNYLNLIETIMKEKVVAWSLIDHGKTTDTMI